MFEATAAPNLLYVIATPMVLLMVMIGIAYAIYHFWGKSKSE